MTSRDLLFLVAALDALGVTACVGSGALPGASASPVPARLVSSATSAATSCAGRARQPTNSTWTLEVGGKTRTFVVHVPPAYDPAKPTPLVLNFHGHRMNPKLHEWLTSMSTTADAAGFILVYPEGTGSPRSFNGGGCCGVAKDENVDDVGFTRAMLDRLEADLCVDPARVFATGMSNGGFMSHRLACELSDRIAAIAPVSGVNAAATCTPTRAVSVLDFHGIEDGRVPYYGESTRGWPSVNETINAWAARDGCTGPTVVTSITDDVHCVTHTQCRDGAEVELCMILDGGHTWPGGKDIPFFLGLGKTTHAVDANARMWDFFQRHPFSIPSLPKPAPRE